MILPGCSPRSTERLPCKNRHPLSERRSRVFYVCVRVYIELHYLFSNIKDLMIGLSHIGFALYLFIFSFGHIFGHIFQH
jgi:hypothetical protein